MPEPRDTLVNLILDCQEGAMSANESADHLLAAGVRPPARVIETEAERDALPVGSIVLDFFGASCTRVHSDPLMGWVRATSALPNRMGVHQRQPYLPATVLHEPEDADR